MAPPRYASDFTDVKVFPLRFGNCADLENQAKAIAGGIGRHDSQEWIPPVKVPIVYPKGENRQTRIPLESDWSPFESCRGWPACRHTGSCQKLDVADSERDQDLDGHNDRDHVDPDAEWDWVPEGREELPDTWYDVPEIPRGFVTDFDHRKKLKDFRTDDQGRWYHKRLQPYRTWDTSSRKVRDENAWTDAEDDWNTPGKARGPLYEGKRAAAGRRNTMPDGSWGVDKGARWSTKLVFCAVVGCDEPVAEDRDKYCSAECADEGERVAERVRTARLTVRKWPAGPVDAGYWYAQQGTLFDLGSVSVAGIGRRDICPKRWNRYQPRNKCARALAVACLWAEQTGAPYRDIAYPLAVHEDIARRLRTGNRPWPVSMIVRGTWQIGLAAPGDYLLSA